MVASTLINSMNENMLLRQIIVGCKAKQYTHARKLFAYLIRRDRMKGWYSLEVDFRNILDFASP